MAKFTGLKTEFAAERGSVTFCPVAGRNIENPVALTGEALALAVVGIRPAAPKSEPGFGALAL